MNYSNHRLAGCAIIFTPETEKEVLEFWKEEGVEKICSGRVLNEETVIGISINGNFDYWSYNLDIFTNIFPSVAAAREYLATLDEFKWGEEVVVSDDGLKWYSNRLYGSKVIPDTDAYNKGYRHNVCDSDGLSCGSWKHCRRHNTRLAEIEKQIKELEAERDKIKSKV